LAVLPVKYVEDLDLGRPFTTEARAPDVEPALRVGCLQARRTLMRTELFCFQGKKSDVPGRFDVPQRARFN
jgi:hypothetical protein